MMGFSASCPGDAIRWISWKSWFITPYIKQIIPQMETWGIPVMSFTVNFGRTRVLNFLCVCMQLVALSCPIFCDPIEYSLPVSSVQGTLQARIVEWVAISFSREFSWPRDRNQGSNQGLLHCREIFCHQSYLGSPEFPIVDWYFTCLIFLRQGWTWHFYFLILWTGT